MRNIRLRQLARTLFALLSCSLGMSLSLGGEEFGERPASDIDEVSIYRLIANPNEFKGKPVYTTGFFVADPEALSLCPSRDDARFALLGNCLSLDLDLSRLKLKQDALKMLEGRVVGVVGEMRVLATKPGYGRAGTPDSGLITYLPLFAGELADVSYVGSLSDAKASKHE